MKKRTLIVASAVAGAALATVAGFVWYGGYNISATDQHLAPTYWLLDTAMRRSVMLRAKDIDVPPLDDESRVRRGAAEFKRHCVGCHGAPGVAPEPFALGLTPVPANLVYTGREWAPAEIFWTVREGIKMTGMPAWRYRLSEDAIWSVVAFMRVLPTLTPDAYRSMAESLPEPPPHEVPALGVEGDAERGRKAIHQHACVTCHAIPGIVGPNAPVGPPLAGIGTRAFIAGVLPNTRETMIEWLRSPQSIRPHAAMPDLGVTERDAADMAAFLATLR